VVEGVRFADATTALVWTLYGRHDVLRAFDVRTGAEVSRDSRREGGARWLSHEEGTDPPRVPVEGYVDRAYCASRHHVLAIAERKAGELPHAARFVVGAAAAPTLYRGHALPLGGLAISEDGRRLAVSIGDDGRFARQPRDAEVRVLDLASGA